MATVKQIEANRRNALKSTGPKTPEGKAAVRMNALRHGLRARSILIPGENPADYDQLCAGLQAEWRPQTPTEQLLVEQMAVAQWKLARLEVGERSIYMQDMGAERQLALLDRFSVQRGRLERSFFKALRELRELRQAPKAQPLREEAPAVSRTQPSPVIPQLTYLMADRRSPAPNQNSPSENRVLDNTMQPDATLFRIF
jgi:hypothetical protein